MIKKFVSTTLGITGLAVLIGASGIMCAMNTAQAQYVGPNQTQTYTTVSQILKNPVDDQYFNLKGKITDKQGHERYTFTDSTGSIRAEIDADALQNGNDRFSLFGQGILDTRRNFII